MPNSSRTAKTQTQRIGIADDHGGFELKQYLAGKLREDGHHVTDLGDRQPTADTDYPEIRD